MIVTTRAVAAARKSKGKDTNESLLYERDSADREGVGGAGLRSKAMVKYLKVVMG
jgi:hypothetical protein